MTQSRNAGPSQGIRILKCSCYCRPFQRNSHVYSVPCLFLPPHSKTVTLDILPSRPKDATHLVSFSKNNISLTDKISSGMPHETVSVENVGTAPNLLIHFPVVCEFIEDAVDKGCKVLVCYEDGTSPDWAGTVVAAYVSRSDRHQTHQALTTGAPLVDGLLPEGERRRDCRR